MTSITVTLIPVDTSRAPAEVQIRRALKELLRTHGIRAKWPEPETPQAQPEQEGGDVERF